MPLANWLGDNRYLMVLRDSFMLAFPLTMFGSIIVVINNLPFFNDDTKGMLSNLLGNGQNATMSIMTVLLHSVSALFISIYDGRYFGGAVAFQALILTPFFMSTGW